MKYDLLERTFKFSLKSILTLKSLKIDYFNNNILSQLLKSSTSIGANYREANNSVSKKDFINKIAICKKEVYETNYWIDLLLELYPAETVKLAELKTEAHELALIFTQIMRSLKKN